MAITAIRIGAPVFSSDGTFLGNVKAVLYDEASAKISQIVADKGLFDRGRIIDLDTIENSDADGVLLTIGRDASSDLAQVVSQAFTPVPGSREVPVRSSESVELQGAGVPWIATGSADVGDLPSIGGPSLFMVEPIGNFVTEVYSTLDSNDIRLDGGTDVIASDGGKIGELSTVLLDADGRPERIVVDQGFIFRRKVIVPLEWIVGASNARIRLNVSSEYAEAHQDELDAG